ncbi:hypothetical protein D9611_013278 [Ephemerocybe angulata]|uniref:F-box domain-containing protein n=1 Tax=Ephemerocybe angulata TaxID=980116 RepID=A0A8H5FIY6_9AGAR|nr:hypothetical protein D9611_013278 [Tulosesus angulatus]
MPSHPASIIKQSASALSRPYHHLPSFNSPLPIFPVNAYRHTELLSRPPTHSTSIRYQSRAYAQFMPPSPLKGRLPARVPKAEKSSEKTKSRAIAHINELPTEILAHIFTLSDYEKENSVGLLNLACICKFWHEIIYHFPHFWTHLDIVVSFKFKNSGPHGVLLPKLCQHFDRWYGRAGDVPRSLTLTFQKAATKTRVLYDYLTSSNLKWKSLIFKYDLKGSMNFPWLDGLMEHATQASRSPEVDTSDAAPCWSQLETLEIISPKTYYTALNLPLETVAPNLQHLKVRVCEMRGSMACSIFSGSKGLFASLRTVSWEGYRYNGPNSVEFFKSLLRMAPYLEELSCFVSEWGPIFPSEGATVPLLEHTTLRELSLHGSDSFGQALRRISVPRLEALHLGYFRCHERYRERSLTVNSLNSLLRNSSASASAMGVEFGIKVLDLHGTPFTDMGLLAECIAVRETVETLSLEAPPSWKIRTPSAVFFTGLQDLRNSIHQAEELFPRLRLFEVVYNPKKSQVLKRGMADFALFQQDPMELWAKSGKVWAEEGVDLEDPRGGGLGRRGGGWSLL